LGVHGYILVFSLTSRQSFDQINQVNDALLNTLGDVPDVPRVLVGSMKDLEPSKRQVSHADGMALAEQLGNIPYLECSSMTGENVAEVFHTLLKEIEKDDGLLFAESEEGGCCIL
jgi:Ras homolog enriched in brain